MKRAVIVGGGISGLATAYLLQQHARQQGIDLEVRLVEKEERVGGKIWSIKSDGFLCEWGPNGFLDSKPQTLDLCRDLGADRALLRSNDNARKRFIYTGGELHRLPENGAAFLKSGLISWPGKLRLAMEPFAHKRPQGIDETLAEFGRRRLGSEALRKLIAPMVSGIFAGNPETMSLKSCFPRIAELEEEYGGLIVAMMKLAKKKKAEAAAGKAVAGAAGPGGVLTSFRDGIQTLTDLLAEAVGSETILRNIDVTQVVKGASSPYRIVHRTGDMEADMVVMASPAYAVAGALAATDNELSGLAAGIPYASMTVICFGYDRDRIAYDLNGFGYLIPKEEGTSTLGTLWDSSIFENRAPQGKVLLRSMMGGACFPEYIALSDEEVTARVRADLKTIMGITADPSFVRIFRHEKAIPQYVRGHGDRLAAIEKRLRAHPGLFLTGNSYRGIGLNDCVAAAVRTTADVMSHLAEMG